jgi:hypothetical protein
MIDIDNIVQTTACLFSSRSLISNGRSLIFSLFEESGRNSGVLPWETIVTSRVAYLCRERERKIKVAEYFF